MNLNSSKSNIIPKFNFRDLLIFLVPILIFSLYLFVYNPGILTAASYGQLHQIAIGYFTSAHPIFHTLLEALCLKIFGSPLFIGVFQILIFSVMWMVICKYHRDDSAPSSNLFVVQFIITLIICLIPINAVYSVTLSSNVLFSYSLMFLAFLIKVMLDKNGQMDKKLMILMALTIAVMSGLNNYGIIIAIPTLLAIGYYLFKKASISENNLVIFFAVAILGIFLIASLNFVYDVHTDNTSIHQNDAFNEDINLNAAHDAFYTTTGAKIVEDYENVDSTNLRKGSYNIIDSFVDFWRGNTILNGLFDNPILCMIFSIVLLALIYVRTESEEILFMYIPTFLSMLISLLTGQNNFYAVILTLYLVVIIFAAFFFKLDLKVKNLPKVGKSLARPQSQPAIQAEENYADDEYYSYLESEIEELTLEDINEMLGQTKTEEAPKVSQEPKPVEAPREVKEPKTVETPKEIKEPAPDETMPQDADDLLDQILKEIELEKK